MENEEKEERKCREKAERKWRRNEGRKTRGRVCDFPLTSIQFLNVLASVDFDIDVDSPTFECHVIEIDLDVTYSFIDRVTVVTVDLKQPTDTTLVRSL